MGINKNKILSLLLSCSLIMGVTSCKAEDKSFPELSFPDETKTSETTSGEDIDEASDDITKNIYSISMAVPYSQETINRLSKLYFLKVANNMPEDATGLTIDIDYLDSINTPWIINVIDTPNEGVGFSSVKFWYDNNDVPDIFLVDDLEKVVDGGFAAPLGNYINDYDIGSSGIYGNALTSCMKEDNAYGVPLYQSFMLMYGNMDYVPEDGPIGFRSTYSEFKSYLTSIDSTYNGEEQTIYPMAKAYEMIPYNTGSSYMFMDDSDEMIDSSLSVDLSFIDDLYEDGLAFDIDSNGSDPVVARNAAMWIDSSTNIERWSDYYPDNVYFALMPNNSADDSIELYASSYPLCLSYNSANKEFASKFAAFLCFDTDALMLLNRLEPKIGYYPVCDSSPLWDYICSNEDYGNVSILFRQNVANSYYCPSRGSSIEQKVNRYCASYTAHYGDEETEAFEFNLEACFK